MSLGDESGAHRLDRRLIREDQASSQGVDQQFAADVVDEIVLPLVGDVAAQAGEAVSLAAIRKGRLGAYGAIAEVAVAPLADRAVALEDQSDRVEALVAACTVLVGAVAGKKLRQTEVAGLGFVFGKLGDNGRRRRGSARRAACGRPSIRASRGWFASRASWRSRRPTSARAPRGRSDRHSRRAPSRSFLPWEPACRSAWPEPG